MQVKQGFDVIDLAPDDHFARDRECFVLLLGGVGAGEVNRGGGCRELLQRWIVSIEEFSRDVDITISDILIAGYDVEGPGVTSIVFAEDTYTVLSFELYAANTKPDGHANPWATIKLGTSLGASSPTMIKHFLRLCSPLLTYNSCNEWVTPQELR